jgi:hypothetical protein
VRILLRAAPDVRVQDGFFNPLWFARWANCTEVVQLVARR